MEEKEAEVDFEPCGPSVWRAKLNKINVGSILKGRNEEGETIYFCVLPNGLEFDTCRTLAKAKRIVTERAIGKVPAHV